MSPLTLGFCLQCCGGHWFLWKNSETNDGVYQLVYSLDNANHTFSGVDRLVRLMGSWPGTDAAHEVSVARTRVPVWSQEPSCTLQACVIDAASLDSLLGCSCPCLGQFLLPRPGRVWGQLCSQISQEGEQNAFPFAEVSSNIESQPAGVGS